MSAAAKNLPPPLIETTPGRPFAITFQLVFAVTNQVTHCPSFRVQPGMTVSIAPVNGHTLNANPCFIADHADLVGTSSGRSLPAAADVNLGWLCENTNQIFAAGTATDGILVTISQGGVG